MAANAAAVKTSNPQVRSPRAVLRTRGATQSAATASQQASAVARAPPSGRRRAKYRAGPASAKTVAMLSLIGELPTLPVSRIHNAVRPVSLAPCGHW